MKDVWESRTERVSCGVSQSEGEGSPMVPDEGKCRSRSLVGGCSLEALLPKLKAISEEQAWALCHLTSVFVLESSPPVRFELTFANVFVKPDGVVYVSGAQETDQDGNLDDARDVDGDSSSLEGRQLLDEVEVITSLGVLVFNALDYGLDEETERQLSPAMQEVIEHLMGGTEEEEDEEGEEEEVERPALSCVFSGDGSETAYIWPTGPLVAELLIKVCEFRIDSASSLPIVHYQEQCQRMIYEADMMSLYQRESSTFISDLEFLDTVPMDLVRTWRDIAKEVIAGINLKPAKQVKSLASIQSDIIRQLQMAGHPTRLKHVERVVRYRKEDILREIKAGKNLKPAANRVLPELVEEKTPLEELLSDISSRKQLRKVGSDEKRYRDKPAPDTNTVLFRALRRAENDHGFQDCVSPAVDEDRVASRTHSGRARSASRRKQTPLRRQMRYALETSRLRVPLRSQSSGPTPITGPLCRGRAASVTPFLDFKGFSSPSSSLTHIPSTSAPTCSPLPGSDLQELSSINPSNSRNAFSDEEGMLCAESLPYGKSRLTESPCSSPDSPSTAEAPTRPNRYSPPQHADRRKCSMDEDISRSLQVHLLAETCQAGFPVVSRTRSIRKRQSLSTISTQHIGGNSPRLVNRDSFARRVSPRRSDRLQSVASAHSLKPSNGELFPMGSAGTGRIAQQRSAHQLFYPARGGVRSNDKLNSDGENSSGTSSPTGTPKSLNMPSGFYSLHSQDADEAEPDCRIAIPSIGIEETATHPPSDLLQSTSSAMPLLMTGGLTHDEIMSIRTIQTDLDLECMEDVELSAKLKAGKVCFSCRRKKFTFFGYLATRQCILCRRKVCQECITKVILLDVDFSNSNIASDVDSMEPIDACGGCRISLLTIARQGPKLLARQDRPHLKTSSAC